MQFPFMQNMFRIEPVTFNEWLYVIVLAVPMVFGIELYKLFNSKKII
jgi:hypothetical protein